MNEKRKLTEQMDTIVHQFKEEFNQTFGITPFVSINVITQAPVLLPMEALRKIIDKLLFTATAQEFSTIIVKSSDRRVTAHRQIFIKIAMDLGYKLTKVAKYLNQHHSTVYYANRLVTNLLATNNAKVKSLFDTVTYQITMYNPSNQKNA